MRRKPVQILVLVLVALLVVTAAGCGKKKSSTTTTTTEATTTTTAATTTSAGTTTSSSGSGLGALAGSCSEITGLGQAFAQALQGSGGDISKVVAALQKFADGAPADIRPAFETVAAGFAKIADALKGVKAGSVPDAGTLAKLTQLASSLNSAAFTKAVADIETWAATNCHG